MKKTLSVFNKTRESFLTLGAAVADTHLGRLRGLIGTTRLGPGEGLWTLPSQGIHTLFLLFPVDVLYLDSGNRVVYAIESLASFRIGPYRSDCASVLQLPIRTIYSSHTEVGDQLLICRPEEIDKYLDNRQQRRASATAAAPSRGPATRLP